MIEELLTIAIAALPVAELRGAIPLAVLVWEIDPLQAYILGVVGNFLPVIPLLLFWQYLTNWFSNHFYYCNLFFSWLFERTRKKHVRRFESFEEIALLLLVAIPLPFTGAWTGTVAAFVFGVPIRRAAPMIGLGILISGLIVSGSIGLFT